MKSLKSFIGENISCLGDHQDLLESTRLYHNENPDIYITKNIDDAKNAYKDFEKKLQSFAKKMKWEPAETSGGYEGVGAGYKNSIIWFTRRTYSPSTDSYEVYYTVYVEMPPKPTSIPSNKVELFEKQKRELLNKTADINYHQDYYKCGSVDELAKITKIINDYCFKNYTF